MGLAVRARLVNAGIQIRLACISLLAIALAASASCDGGCPNWDDALKNERPLSSEVTKSANVNSTNELVVYLDTSGSMPGYLARDGHTIFGKTLRELRFAAGTFSGASNLRVLVRHIGSNVGDVLPDIDLTTASQDPSLFNAGETDLAGAISSFKNSPHVQQQQSGSQGDASADAPPARFHILVTDGVQSTRKGSNPQDCSAGSDQFCVRQKIGELLEKGWGGCVLGVRADFHGKVYSEVSRSGIPYDSNDRDPSSLRPFYLYMFSPDPAALDPLVNTIKDRLRQFVPSDDSIRELNLSYPYTTGSGDFELRLPQDSNSKDFLSTRAELGSPQRFTIRVSVDTERDNIGAKSFEIIPKISWSRHALDSGTATELLKLLSWKLVPVYPATNLRDERYPESKLSSDDASNGAYIRADTRFRLGREAPSCRIYRLEARINLNQATPEWIRAWSTDLDNTRESGNRTFNLETALLGLWNISTAKDQVVALAYLRLGPPE